MLLFINYSVKGDRVGCMLGVEIVTGWVLGDWDLFVVGSRKGKEGEGVGWMVLVEERDAVIL